MEWKKIDPVPGVYFYTSNKKSTYVGVVSEKNRRLWFVGAHLTLGTSFREHVVRLNGWWAKIEIPEKSED